MDAEAALREIRRLRESTRQVAHAGAWFPVAVLACLLLASIALYRLPFGLVGEPAGTGRLPGITSAVTWMSYPPYWPGLPSPARSMLAAYLFWFAGTPLAIAAIGVWYRRRAARIGMRVQWKWFAITGIGALAGLALLATVPVESPLWSNGAVRGLATPLVPLAVALCVLGWTERSLALALSAAWIGLVAFWHCSMGMGWLPGPVVWVLGGFKGPALGGQLTLFGLHHPGPALIAMALPLLVFVAVRVTRDSRVAR
jgi:hypothetical protein